MAVGCVASLFAFLFNTEEENVSLQTQSTCTVGTMTGDGWPHCRVFLPLAEDKLIIDKYDRDDLIPGTVKCRHVYFGNHRMLWCFNDMQSHFL